MQIKMLDTGDEVDGMRMISLTFIKGRLNGIGI